MQGRARVTGRVNLMQHLETGYPLTGTCDIDI